MSRKHAVARKEDFPVPPDVSTLDGFLRWAASDDFPDTGRIDYLAGQLEVEMSPEEVLPGKYAKAEIPEFWRVDARGLRMLFEVFTLEQGQYVRVDADAEGWVLSPRLGLRFRLRREAGPFSSWRYTLEHRPD